MVMIVGIAVMALFSGQAALAEKRIALVIGNSDYTFAPLSNPKNDASLMTETLKGLGFEVITAINATQKGMKKSIKSFGKKLNSAGQDGVGLFYYAGHGVQVNGANFLIPTDAQIETEADVDIDAINAQSVLSMMEYSGARLSFVIMDACRNNPFKRSFRSGARGLAKMEAPTGSLIAYATAPGDVASDGTGNNSPYTTALVQKMNTPGLSVERMFREVRNSVRSETKNSQTPWESSSLTGGDFYFNRNAELSPVLSQPSTSNAANVNMEAMFWQSIQGSKDAEDYRAYLEQYPSGAFTALAKVKIKKFEESNVAVVASQPAPTRTIDALKGYSVWVRSNSDTGRRYCRLLEEASLNVKCHIADLNMAPKKDISLQCPSLPADAGEILKEYLGFSGFKIYDFRSMTKLFSKTCHSFNAIDLAVVE
jgi:uncharacterized caspase-like protein